MYKCANNKKSELKAKVKPCTNICLFFGVPIDVKYRTVVGPQIPVPPPSKPVIAPEIPDRALEFVLLGAPIFTSCKRDNSKTTAPIPAIKVLRLAAANKFAPTNNPTKHVNKKNLKSLILLTSSAFPNKLTW